MSMLPIISIITPSYNQASYLEATISSVLEQDYPHIEYLILDGGSTDGSVNLIRKYGNRLAYWESAPDAGQADAINRGFARTTGDILAWLNSDDTYEPGALARVASAFQQYPEADLIYGEGWYMDAVGMRLRPCSFVRPNFPWVYMVNKDPILQQSAFWRRSLWERVGPLDTNLNWVFDWDWFLRAHGVGKFQYIPHFLANYRVHPAAKTRSSAVQRRIEQRRLTCRYGRWWHPNALVQQTRIWSAQAPIFFRPIAKLLQRSAEAIFYARYTS